METHTLPSNHDLGYPHHGGKDFTAPESATLTLPQSNLPQELQGGIGSEPARQHLSSCSCDVVIAQPGRQRMDALKVGGKETSNTPMEHGYLA